jgi:predicted lipoprotein with Yx(FWY)xxD motif
MRLERRGRKTGRERGHTRCWRWSRGVGSIGLVAAGLVLAACGSSSNPPAIAAGSASVAVHSYRLSTGPSVLVDGSGQALYMFAPDAQKTVTCAAACLRSWPLLYVPAGMRPKVGSGVEARLVGTVKASALGSGAVAVTYNRWPLYTYADDVSPGMTSGQGTDLNGGYWYLIQTNGMPLVPPGDPAA